MKLQRPNIKINKTWLMLIVAIVLSLLTAWLSMQYLRFREQSMEAEIKARTQDKGGTVAVVVPIKALPPGTLLEENLVAARNISADFVYEDTITVAQFDALKGQALIRPVERGRPLRKADVREVFADFSGTLKAGRRAMTIAVDEMNSVSHMVEPGNMVDLMLVISSGQEPGGSNQTVVPFLDQIKVLATGQKVTQDDPATASTERRRSYSNLTLEVTPTQAARLALAQELGKLRAVLRNEKDRQEVDFETVSANNLLEDIRERERERRMARAAEKPAARAPYSASYVEYFIGGKGGSDAVAPVINVPMPASLTPTPAGPAAAAPTGTAAAQAALPQSLTDLIKLSTANSQSAGGKPSK